MKNPLELFRRLFVNEKKKTARTSCKKQKPQSLFLRHARKVMEEKKGGSEPKHYRKLRRGTELILKIPK